MSTGSLEIKLVTVTPLWTGGADGRADRLHSTGIVGSLRWWYEVMVRGLGGDACDPSKHTCLYDPDKPPDYGLCDVCRVFGATGWARRFRLLISDEASLRSKSPWDAERRITASRSYKDRSGKEEKIPTWFFDNPPLDGNTSIEIISTNKQFQAEIIGGFVQFLASWASIGARPQMGFGIINCISHQDTQYLLAKLLSSTGSKIYGDLPSLQNIFFTGISESRFPSNESFNLKYDVRRLFAANTDLRHFVMGTVQKERQGAKIMLSRPYENKATGKSTIRIWGWIPEEVTKFNTSRDQIIKQIHDHLRARYNVDHWRASLTPYAILKGSIPILRSF